jgi:hypothetical protein
MPDTITCPKCGTEIEVAQALSARLEEGIRREVEAKAATVEQALRQKEQELVHARAALDAQVKAAVEAERAQIAAAARQEAAQAVSLEVSSLQQQLDQAKNAERAAKKQELEVRVQQKALQQEKDELELTVQRRLAAEQEEIRKQTRRQALEETSLQVAERDKQIADMRKQIDDLKHSAEQGSQQLQGEVQELALEELLRAAFPTDGIEPVGKGVRGADTIQRVRDEQGAECGAVVWESKRTRNWSEAWIQKLKDDLRAAKGVLAVLVTEAMPKGVEGFGEVGGVWVCDRANALRLGAVLRHQLVEVGRARRAAEGRQDKMELLYGYLAGPDFRNRVTGIVEAFRALQEDLDGERRTMERLWAKRAKQLERAMMSSTGMYGDLQGIIGASLPSIEALEAPALGTGGELPVDGD